MKALSITGTLSLGEVSGRTDGERNVRRRTNMLGGAGFTYVIGLQTNAARAAAPRRRRHGVCSSPT